MTWYKCLGCNENCEWSESQMKEFDLINVCEEIVDCFCPKAGMFTEFEKVEYDDEDSEEM